MEELIRHPLAYARIERDWAQEDLARLIRSAAERRGLRSGVQRQRVWKWENNRAVPDHDSQLLIADVFGIAPQAVADSSWPNWLPGHDRPLALAPGSAVPALREALRTAMDRRNFVTLSSAALAGLALDWVVTEPTAMAAALDGGQVDADLVGMLETTGAKLTTLVTEQRQHTPTLIDAHLATVTELISSRNYTAPIARRLHHLAGRLAQTTAWYRFDHSKHASAARFWTSAVHSAHAAGDRDLGAGNLSDLAYQSTWLGRPAEAATILEHALTHAEHPTARSLLQLRLARAQAALGDSRACRRALTAAETQLQKADSADAAPAWCGWMSSADLLVDSGRCMLDLGHAARGRELIHEGKGLLPAPRAKTRAVFLTYEADGLLKAGEVDQAASAAIESLRVSRRIGAPRCETLVRKLLPAFEPYTSIESVQELHHDLPG